MAAVFTIMSVTQLDANCVINSQFSVCLFVFHKCQCFFINEQRQQM